MRNIGAGFEARDTGHRRALAQSENIPEFLAATSFPLPFSFTLHLKKPGTLSVSIPRMRISRGEVFNRLRNICKQGFNFNL